LPVSLNLWFKSLPRSPLTCFTLCWHSYFCKLNFLLPSEVFSR
jgi:hypothetical protein